jgi:hypothetical protein
MTTSQLPTPTLQPVAEEKNLLTIVESGAACCGGECCSLD